MNNTIQETLPLVHANDQVVEKSTLHWIRFFWWLRSLIYLWVKSKSLPKESKGYEWDPKKPVCYVLNLHSITDLMVLDYHCEKLKLPRPRLDMRDLSQPGHGAYVYLAKSGFFQRKRSKPVPTGLFRLLEKVQAEESDIQLIPVSVFWGRNAGKEEKSLFKLLFFDDEQGGWLQRFILFFVQGRNVFCSFGKPISILDYVHQEKELVSGAKKLRRVLRVHFHRQRESMIGPYLYDHRHMTHSILHSKSIRDLFEQELAKKTKSKEKLEEQARRYIDEIAANMSPHVVRFMDILLSLVFRKIYKGVDVRNGDKLRAITETHEVVYLPCHRSHMDYLLLGYSLYHLGVSPPHTAAGVNLNFWPIGSLFRRGGAFFIRRSFGGNKLYSAVFTEYVNFLLSGGYSMCFYMEGGRSRTGRLLQPKLGMIGMVLKSFQENPVKPIMLVPTFISYDKLLEARSYFHELKGKAKKAESIWQLFRMPKILRYEFGKAYINFGEPIDLGNYLKALPDSQDSNTLHNLSRDVMSRINRASHLTPISLFSVAMLSLSKRAISEKQLVMMVNSWMSLLRAVPYDARTIIPDADAKDLLKTAETLSQVNRFEHDTGDVIFVNDKDCVFLNYYRNNSLPVFIIPSLIANILNQCRSLTLNELNTVVMESYCLLKNDFFLKWERGEVEAVIRSYIQAMGEFKLVNIREDRVHAPDKDMEEAFFLECLGRVIGNVMERYCLYLSILTQEDSSVLELDAFAKNCENLAKKSSILSGYHEFDFIDKNEHKLFLETLVDLNYVKRVGSKIHKLEGLALSVRNMNPLYELIMKKLLLSGKENYEGSKIHAQ